LGSTCRLDKVVRPDLARGLPDGAQHLRHQQAAQRQAGQPGITKMIRPSLTPAAGRRDLPVHRDERQQEQRQHERRQGQQRDGRARQALVDGTMRGESAPEPQRDADHSGENDRQGDQAEGHRQRAKDNGRDGTARL